MESIAILDATANGEICFATEKATALLTRYFANPRRLPDTLVRCLKNHRGGRVIPWSAHAGAEQLILHLTGREGAHFQLLLEKRTDASDVEQLVDCLDLTPREAEVLLWIAKGKTSAAIAAILDCATATVNKHTERIFAKIGVETRTAAAAVAAEVIA
jgi:DNA-binding CsgD family transcriptional regulator